MNRAFAKRVKAGISVIGVALMTLTTATVVSSSSAGASSPPLVVGADSDNSGAAGLPGGFLPGIAAWADWTNAHGGVDGRKVDLNNLDSAGDVTAIVSNTNKLINQDHVIALFPGTPTGNLMLPLATAAKIPLIGGSNVGTLTETAPGSQWYFPEGTSASEQTESLAVLGFPKGNKKLGVMACTDITACSQILPVLKSGVLAAGGTYVGSVGLTSTDSSAQYDSDCLKMKSLGANEVMLDSLPPEDLRIVPACAAQGYKPQWISGSAVLSSSFLQVPALVGTLAAYTAAPYFATTKQFPALKTYNQAINKYEPSAKTESDFGEQTLLGWLSGELFADAVTAAKVPAGKAVTSADVTKGLYALKNETLDGLTGPLNFTKGKGNYEKCFYDVAIATGKFIAPSNKVQCLK
jgi:branched-chain amino acid transport system substrate-binding protein